MPLKKSGHGGRMTKRLIELRQLPGSTFGLQLAHAVALQSQQPGLFCLWRPSRYLAVHHSLPFLILNFEQQLGEADHEFSGINSTGFIALRLHKTWLFFRKFIPGGFNNLRDPTSSRFPTPQRPFQVQGTWISEEVLAFHPSYSNGRAIKFLRQKNDDKLYDYR